MMKRLLKSLSQFILVSILSLLSQGKERIEKLYIFFAFECGAECLTGGCYFVSERLFNVNQGIVPLVKNTS